VPQITVEWSGNFAAFDAGTFARHIHLRLGEHADAALANCKTRLVRHDAFLVSDGDPAGAFIHVDLRILPGRSAQQKQSLGAAVLTDLEQAVAHAAGFDLQLTVEVRELDGDNYHKRRLSP